MGLLKVLVVDDEPDIVELVTYNLRKEGFEVSSASDGEKALSMLRKGHFGFVILDLMLPGIQGLELCRILRNDPHTKQIPIIMLTARDDEVDRVLGLEIGADDYMTKPFSPRELIARVRSVRRRAARDRDEEQVLRLGSLSIHRDTYTVMKRDLRIDLSSTEFRLLLYLAERKGMVFSRDQLLDAVWKNEAYVEPRTVDVHIRRLRSRIEDDASNPRYIKTRRGIGYYVEADL